MALYVAVFSFPNIYKPKPNFRCISIVAVCLGAPEMTASSYPPTSTRNYDVFLSFSLTDTRKTFTSHLLAALERRGFRTFRDDIKLRRGEEIGPELLNMIHQSSLSIVVFSKNYASSRWCLDELVHIMESRKKWQQIVLPVFYDVDPSTVRSQSGHYTQAFAEHEKHFKLGQLKKWRQALSDAANLSGWDLQHVANGHEAKFIDEIVKEVTNKLNHTPLSVADHPVGIESRIQKLGELLNLRSNDVHIIAIWGMGGIGKTTVAKALYNIIHGNFKSSSFLANVRGTWSQPNGVVELQKKFLSDILMDENCMLKNEHQGIQMIKERAWCRRVFLVLDDVDDASQLRALCINRALFGFGSRIVVTTRDLSSLGSLLVDEVYALDELNEKDSLEMFSWHAFNKEHPVKDYEQLSCEVVGYAKGLPLVLEILGSCLFGQTVSEWKSELMKLKRIPHGDVQRQLQLSFNSLDAEQKQLFLDIACFFVGVNKYISINVLEGCGFFSASGIRALKCRSLVKIDERSGVLTMHDMIQDMGREIVRQESPQELGERSRLWHHMDVLDVLRYKLGTKAIECLSLDLTGASEGPVNTKAFAKMNRLRLLRLYYVQLSGSFKHLSRRLIELRWVGCSLKCFPFTIYIDNLVLLDLSNSSRLKYVWGETKVLNKLKFLYLDHCNSLTKTPSFRGSTNLEKLSLVGCMELVEVDKSVGYLKKLEFLNLKDCRNLEKLPQSVFMLKSLASLDLSGCSKLVKLVGAQEGSPHKWWNSLYRGLPHGFRHAKILDFVRLTPASIRGLSCIKRLYLANCNISYVPSEIGSLISLDYLDLSGNIFSCLPPTICNLAQLRGLALKECTLLQSIPTLPENLNVLIARDCNSLERISIRATRGGQGMNLCHCPRLLDGNLANDFREGLLCCKEFRGLDTFSVAVGGSEAPNWCEYRCMGPLLSLVLPQQPWLHQEMLGLMFCAVFDFHHEQYRDMVPHSQFDLNIHNKTKGIMRNMNAQYKKKGLVDYECLAGCNVSNCEGQMWLVYFSNRWLDVEFEGGDELELSMVSGLCRVKELGVSPINLSHVGVNDSDIGDYFSGDSNMYYLH